MTRHHRNLLGPMTGIECDRCHRVVPYTVEDGMPKGWGRRWAPVFDVDVCPDCLKDWPPDAPTGDGFA